MRPIPKPHFRTAAWILTAVAVVYAVMAWRDDRLSDTQMYMSAAALKYHEGQLFRNDTVFGQTRLWQFHTPLNQRLMDLALSVRGYEDLLLPYRLLVGPLTLAFLMGMFLLLYRQCQSWSVATFTAVLSTTIVFTLGRSYWGEGSLGTMTPWTICLTSLPWVIIAFLKYRNSFTSLLLIFGFVGLLGNVHLVAAMDFTLVLAIAYLGWSRMTPKAWGIAAVCCLVAIVAASPSLWYFWSLRQAMNPPGVHADSSVVYQAFRVAELAVFYPEVFLSTFNWIVLIALVLVIPSALVLGRFERYRVRDLSTWVWFMGAVLAVAFVFHGASQAVGIARNDAPPVIDFVQAASLLMLPLYVFFAQAVSNFFRLGRSHRWLIRLILGAILMLWMIPSDNLRVARYGALDMATMSMAETDRPQAVQRHHARAAEHQEMLAIAGWSSRQTPLDAVFVTDLPEFRLHSRRAIVTCAEDVRYIYYFMPGQLKPWLDRIEQQTKLLHPHTGRCDGQAIARFVDDLSSPRAATAPVSMTATAPSPINAPAWYVILPASDAPEEPGESLTPITDSRWGQFYKLYRVRQTRWPIGF